MILGEEVLKMVLAYVLLKHFTVYWIPIINHTVVRNTVKL